ncbi:hypothetical protein [Paratractidigestivibacter sp.]|uniref:hypothetical protein n=1 Tax=Paratractidigestivibacter sp. TaxID=2847316 RepID=UPI002ACB0B7E|nr:hypothetical protein [Paratractidigestivibacter sp.]
MRERLCRDCGAAFTAETAYQYTCPSCREKNIATTLATRGCCECGKSFVGGPGARYCPDCRAERKKAQNREQRRRGTQRPLGSTDICKACGKEYIVEGGLQKYCPECAPEINRKKMNERNKEWRTKNKEKIYDSRAKKNLCCVCGRIIPSTGTVTNVCSEWCKNERDRRRWYDVDINRGKKTTPYGVIRKRGMFAAIYEIGEYHTIEEAEEARNDFIRSYAAMMEEIQAAKIAGRKMESEEKQNG